MDNDHCQCSQAYVRPLEDEFDDAMMSVYRAAKNEFDYNATYFLNMLYEHGGVETAHKLLGDQTIQNGFRKLWDCERLDLTLECLVLNRRFARLFDEREPEEARRRLRNHDYDPSGCA